MPNRSHPFLLIFFLAAFALFVPNLHAETSEEYVCLKDMSVYSEYCLGPTRSRRMNYLDAVKTCESENKLLASPYILKEWAARSRVRSGFGFWGKDKGKAFIFTPAGGLIQEHNTDYFKKNYQRNVRCMERAKVIVHKGGGVNPNPAPYGSKKGSDWGCWCLGEIIRSLFGGGDSD